MYVDEGIAFIIIWTSLPEFYKKRTLHEAHWKVEYIQLSAGLYRRKFYQGIQLFSKTFSIIQNLKIATG